MVTLCFFILNFILNFLLLLLLSSCATYKISPKSITSERFLGNEGIAIKVGDVNHGEKLSTLRKEHFSVVAKKSHIKEFIAIADKFEEGLNICQMVTGLKFVAYPKLRLFVYGEQHANTNLALTASDDRLQLLVAGVLVKNFDGVPKLYFPDLGESLGVELHEWVEAELIVQNLSVEHAESYLWISGNRTRWLREGVAEYCAHLLQENALNQVSRQMYTLRLLDLFVNNKKLLDWSSSSEIDLYDNSFALVKRMVSENVLVKTLEILKTKKTVSKADIIDSVEEAGFDLEGAINIESYKYIDGVFSYNTIDISDSKEILFECMNNEECFDVKGEVRNINNKIFPTIYEYEHYIQSLSKGDKVTVAYLKNGELHEVVMKVNEAFSHRELPSWMIN